MEFQQPAEGIMKTSDFGNTVSYKVACSCGCSDPDHVHELWVESDRGDVNVTIYIKARNDWNSRWRTIWQLLTRGYVEYDSEIILTKQQAHNYAETLNRAVADVEKFNEKNKN